MLVDPTPGPDYDATIRLFNSDGSEPELSGNGTRCAAALLVERGYAKEDIRIRTGAGIKHLRTLGREGSEFQFEMNMGVPRIVARRRTLDLSSGPREATLIDVGNPHALTSSKTSISIGAAPAPKPSGTLPSRIAAMCHSSGALALTRLTFVFSKEVRERPTVPAQVQRRSGNCHSTGTLGKSSYGTNAHRQPGTSLEWARNACLSHRTRANHCRRHISS